MGESDQFTGFEFCGGMRCAIKFRHLVSCNAKGPREIIWKLVFVALV